MTLAPPAHATKKRENVRFQSRTLLKLHVVVLLLVNHDATAQRTIARWRRKRFQQRSREEQRLSDEWIVAHSDTVISPCPCVNPHFCHPVSSSSPIRESGEVFGFATEATTGESYNWTHISTVAWASSDPLMCHAHQHGARAVLATPSFNLTQIASNKTYISEWVRSTLAMVKARHRDGIVFDYEEPMSRNSPLGSAYVSLIQATRDAFHQNCPPLQVSTCVAWSPDGIDGRNYPHVELADASDLLYIMDYDTQSQITQGPCIASANAPISGMIQGIERYLGLGLDPKKLVLGVPWYGYRYPCLEGTAVDAQYCPIRKVPFRGVNCSDAAGSEIWYSRILQTYRSMTDKEINMTGGMRRDEYMDAAFFNQIVTNDKGNPAVVQYWFDDAQSLRNKLAWIKSKGLGGVGPYQFDNLDPLTLPDESRDVWSAFDVFRSVDGDGNKTQGVLTIAK